MYSFLCTLCRTVATRQVNRLLVKGNFGRERLWIKQLLFPQCLGGETSLFL